MRFESVLISRPQAQIVSQIEQGIRDGRLVEGQKLPTERELSQQFGVGRGVIREAIKILDAMGLLESRQGSGSYVRNDPLPTISKIFTFVGSTSNESVSQLFEFRRALECVSARWAAERRTDTQATDIREIAKATRVAVNGDDVNVLDQFTELDQRFHQCIFDATCNPYLGVTLGSIRRMQIEVITLINREVGSLVVAADHHLEIAKAIVERDADAAAAAMDRHIVYTATRVAESLATPLGRTAEKGGTDGQSTERHWS